MDERQDDPETLRTTRLRPRTLGRSVPVPPLIPTVVIVSLVVGLVIGFGLGSKPGPPPAPSLPATATSPPAGGSAASESVVNPLPPAGGLTLAQALVALKGAAVGSGSPSDLISARLARFGDVASGALPPDRWVWAFVVRGATTELAVFDYQTGEFIEDRIPAYP